MARAIGIWTRNFLLGSCTAFPEAATLRGSRGACRSPVAGLVGRLPGQEPTPRHGRPVCLHPQPPLPRKRGDGAGGRAGGAFVDYGRGFRRLLRPSILAGNDARSPVPERGVSGSLPAVCQPSAAVLSQVASPRGRR